MKHATTIRLVVALLLFSLTIGACSDFEPARASGPASNVATSVSANDIDAALRSYLATHGFTGRIASTLEAKLGRRIDNQLADIGRLLWFDPIQGLNDDFTPAELSRAWLESISAPQKAFVPIENVGHFTLPERSDEFLQILRERVLPLAAPPSTQE